MLTKQRIGQNQPPVWEYFCVTLDYNFFTSTNRRRKSCRRKYPTDLNFSSPKLARLTHDNADKYNMQIPTIQFDIQSGLIAAPECFESNISFHQLEIYTSLKIIFKKWKTIKYFLE